MVEVLSAPTTANEVDVSPSDGSPLSVDQQQVLSEAEARFDVVMGSARAASFNAYTSLVLAVMAAPFAIFSFTAMVVCLVLVYVAYVDLDARKRLRRLEVGSARLMGRNQLVLLGAIVLYCAWTVLRAVYGPNPYEPYVQQSPELGEVLGPISELYVTFTCVTYAAVALVSFVVQGLTARYHYKREQVLVEHLGLTPSWVLELQKGRSP